MSEGPRQKLAVRGASLLRELPCVWLSWGCMVALIMDWLVTCMYKSPKSPVKEGFLVGELSPYQLRLRSLRTRRDQCCIH